MADGDLLLNFELPSDAFAPRKTFKGGSWKDRLTAKKSADYGRKKALERANGQRKSIPAFREVRSEDQELIIPGDRPAKRAKISTDGAPHRPTNGQGRKHDDRPSTWLKDGPKGGVVSSLFTYNPKSTAPEAKADEEEPAEVQPSNAPLDDELITFTSLGLSAPLASHLLKKLEIKAPTAIQKKAVQQLCATHTDAFIQAETGSGKTLAYLLPIVERLMQLSRSMKDAGHDFNRESGLFAVILSPTRELSKQISTVLDSLLACCHWIVSGTVIGGEKKKSEKARLRKGVNVLVATPGRLVDHFDNTEVLDVSKVRWLVLDEGDRLMELGFEKDIQKIVSVLNLRAKKAEKNPTPGLPERRTTVLCSATLKLEVDQLRRATLKDAISISVGDEEKSTVAAEGQDATKFAAPAQLKQSFVIAPPKQRLVTLVATLKQTFKRKGSVMKCIVFMSCADSVDFHFELFARQGEKETTATTDTKLEVPSATTTAQKPGKILQGKSLPETRTSGPATAFSHPSNPVQIFRLHGSLPQAIRTSTLMAFTKCTQPAVLICTDVASRGLDLPNIDLVIEYDPPFSRDDHLHRIGRTARAGRDGRAMMFLMPGCEEGYVEILKHDSPRHPVRHEADEVLKKGFTPSSGVVGETDWQDAATEWQLDAERWVLENAGVLEMARRAFQSHVRAYATHVAAERGYFDIKQLHLGHLAKAFGLRDKPGSIRVPGLRPGKNERKTGRKISATKNAGAAGGKSREDVDVGPATDEQEARAKMRAKLRAMGGASEFNVG